MATAMQTFKYSYRDAQGKIQGGEIEAPNENAVSQRLRSMGLAPLSVTPVRQSALNQEIKIPGLGGERISLKDVAILSRQLATMIQAGLSILRALNILAEQTESKALARVVIDVRADVETGVSLSQALSRHPKVFPPLMINMVRAGEVGGFLDNVLISIAENFENEVRLRGKIKSAMAYPTVVFVIAILAVVGMLLFIVPIFTNMFSQLGGELPPLTKALVGVSSFLKVGFLPITVGIIVGVVLWKRNKHKYGFREKVEPLYLKAPVFGQLVRKLAIARFTRNFGAMIRAGVPILQALDIVAEASGNVVVERAAKDVKESVRTGNSLAGPLTEHPIFPSMVVQMISVGEDTGALDTMLEKIADFYDQEVESTTDALTSLIEPLMIGVLGGIIGTMIIALYMPIFGIFDLIN
jgi:type IV pilus assembly protein PilC